MMMLTFVVTRSIIVSDIISNYFNGGLMKKNILCLLVLFCLTAVLLTVEVYADDEAVDAVPIEGQSCGDYVYWAFSGNT